MIDRLRWRYRFGRPTFVRWNRRFWRGVRWLAVRLAVLAVLVTAALTAYHWYKGATFESSVRMMTDDYRLVVACPTEAERIRDFVGRPPRTGGPAAMAASHGSDWVDQVCGGQLTSTRDHEADPKPRIFIEERLAACAASAPTPAATSNAIASMHPSERHLAAKDYMLTLVNAERARAGVPPVVLGDNPAAQLHADASIEGRFMSHWGLDGLKPYMRYTLTGGYQSNAENVSGSNYHITSADGYRALGTVEEEIGEAMEGWIDSAGHLENLLHPWHRKVNIGLAWDTYNFNAVQQFEGDYVEYEQHPCIADGFVVIAGTVKNGAAVEGEDSLGIQIYYDPLHPLTQGQVDRTYCYDGGLLIASLRPRPGSLFYYTEDEHIATSSPCPDPYAVSADAPPARSSEEAHRLWRAAYDTSQTAVDRTIMVP